MHEKGEGLVVKPASAGLCASSILEAVWGLLCGHVIGANLNIPRNTPKYRRVGSLGLCSLLQQG